MIDALAKRICERVTLRQANRLPPAERAKFLRRALLTYTWLIGLTLVLALCCTALCLYTSRFLLFHPGMPSVLPTSQIVFYIVLFAACALCYVFLAVFSAAARRFLTSVA